MEKMVIKEKEVIATDPMYLQAEQTLSLALKAGGVFSDAHVRRLMSQVGLREFEDRAAYWQALARSENAEKEVGVAVGVLKAEQNRAGESRSVILYFNQSIFCNAQGQVDTNAIEYYYSTTDSTSMLDRIALEVAQAKGHKLFPVGPLRDYILCQEDTLEVKLQPNTSSNKNTKELRSFYSLLLGDISYMDKSQISWLIVVAAQHEHIDTIHDRAFLRRWGLEDTYNLYYADNPATLDKNLQTNLRLHEANEAYLLRYPKLKEERDEERKRLAGLFGNPHLLLLLITSRSIRKERMQQNKERTNIESSLTQFSEEAAVRLGFSKEDTLKAIQAYNELLLLVSAHFRLDKKFTNSRRGEDALQDKFVELIDAVASFPYWETMVIEPELTLERLLGYVSKALYTERKETDAATVSIHAGVSRDGEEMTMDMYRASGLDTEEIITANEGYRYLQQLITEETERLELDPRTPQMLKLSMEGYTMKEIAKMLGLPPDVVGKAVLQLRQAVGQKIDPERKVKKNNELNPVWEALINKASIDTLKSCMQSYSLRGFQRKALELAIEKAEELFFLQTENASARRVAIDYFMEGLSIIYNDSSLHNKTSQRRILYSMLERAEEIFPLQKADVMTVRRAIIAYVAQKLRENYSDVSQDDITAQNTARRNIEMAWNLIIGAEAYESADGRNRSSVQFRDSETRNWRNFVANNPSWHMHFTPQEQQIITLYYLTEGAPISQIEIGKVVGIDPSRVSRKLEKIEQQRRRMGEHKSIRQIS